MSACAAFISQLVLRRPGQLCVSFPPHPPSPLLFDAQQRSYSLRTVAAPSRGGGTETTDSWRVDCVTASSSCSRSAATHLSLFPVCVGTISASAGTGCSGAASLRLISIRVLYFFSRSAEADTRPRRHRRSPEAVFFPSDFGCLGLHTAITPGETG